MMRPFIAAITSAREPPGGHRHYKPWVRTLQGKLEEEVRKALGYMNDPRPSVVILAGPNGAGKSTAAPALLHGTLAPSTSSSMRT